MRNIYITWFEIFDVLDTVVTDCADWQLFRSCPRACLFSSQLRLYPRVESEETAFKALLKEAMHNWHNAKMAGDGDALLTLAVLHGRRENCVTYNGTNCYDLLLDYFHFDQRENLVWVTESQTFRHDILPPTDAVPSPPLVLSDRIDGLVMHEGDTYLLVHKAVRMMEDQTEFFKNDFTNSLKAAFAGDMLKIEIKGIAYNLHEVNEGPALPGADKQFAFRRQFLKFKPGRLVSTRVELWQLASRYNELMSQPKNCYSNTNFCHQNGETCIYKPFCDAHMSPDVLEQYKYKESNPHYSREDQEEILEIVALSAAEALSVAECVPEQEVPTTGAGSLS